MECLELIRFGSHPTVPAPLSTEDRMAVPAPDWQALPRIGMYYGCPHCRYESTDPQLVMMHWLDHLPPHRGSEARLHRESDTRANLSAAIQGVVEAWEACKQSRITVADTIFSDQMDEAIEALNRAEGAH